MTKIKKSDSFFSKVEAQFQPTKPAPILPSRLKKSNENKIQGDHNEKIAEKVTELKRVRGSGCGREKGDLRSRTIHVEAKSTKTSRCSLPHHWFEKAQRQAGDRVPVVQVAFTERHDPNFKCLRFAFIPLAVISQIESPRPVEPLKIIGGINQGDWLMWSIIVHNFEIGEALAVKTIKSTDWVVFPEKCLKKMLPAIDQLQRQARSKE